MGKTVDEANRRILEMLEESRVRRQNGLGKSPLADRILRKNGNKLPKLPRLPKV